MPTDIDKSKTDRKRYFACLAMVMLELLELSEEPMVLGESIKKVLDKYKVDLFADKKRCRINLEIPPQLNKPEVINGLQKSLIVRSKEYTKQIKNYRNIIKLMLKKEKANG